MTYTVPVVDLGAATRSSVSAHLLETVKIATEATGVIQVVNHGVPQHLINDFNQRIARLLRLPPAHKAKLASPTGNPYRGWQQWPDDFGRLELERFNVGQFDNVSHARASGLGEEHLGLYADDNVWPDDDPRLHYVTFRYLEAARSVAERVLGLYARAQGLRPSTFPVSPLPYLTLTVNNYPTWTYPDSGNDEDRLLLLERADRSAITILVQDGDYEGLQVQLPGGEWTPVAIVPGALLVFSGTLLTRWTNGRLRPALHRVAASDAVIRQSISVFYYPDLDAVLEPLPPFTVLRDETAFEPATTWDLVRSSVENDLNVFAGQEQITA
jgi:flavonol synthase